MAEVLTMTFDPLTVEHLGVRMYSTLPPVLGELVANSYDADASLVEIELHDTGQKEIVVRDNGTGMSFDDINRKFLRIGRNRRTAEGTQTTPGHRKVIGKKGLGKLSFFGIAHEILVKTVKGGKGNSFILSWNAIKEAAGLQNGLSNYRPEIMDSDVDCGDSDGTEIRLRQIERESDFNPDQLANSLARLFICDDTFHIRISHNGGDPVEVTKERRYVGLSKQVEWGIPADIEFESEFDNKNEIRGLLFATKKPISPNTKMRGITLFSRRKLVNAPEYFSDSTSSHFFSYLTGWLEVDFIDDLDEDVIGTNRQSLNWTHPDMAKLRTHLQKMIRALEIDWRTKRKRKRRGELAEKTHVDVDNWLQTLPHEILVEVSKIVESVIGDSELEDEEQHSVVKSLHNLVPEYPRYHWRHLHAAIRNASKNDYEKQDYYRAFHEAAKRFINETRLATGNSSTDVGMMGQVYGRGKPLSVTAGFKRRDGADFGSDTVNSIEEGQMHLSMGIVAGGRNPVAHEEVADLRVSGLFSEKDCLDGLSLLSHLMKRLEDAKNGRPVHTP